MSCRAGLPVVWLASTAAAAANEPQKSQFHLFNPTPHNLMREMATDRPDTTESPYTVDAGHLQIEFSFIDYTRDADTDAFSVISTNVRIGLLNNLEFAIVFEPYVHVESIDEANHATDSDSGFGNLQLRAKLNLWGNDSGRTALAIMPVVTLPTASRSLSQDHAEPGLIVPFAIVIDDHWSLGLMAEFDVVYDELRATYDLEFLHTVALGRDIVKDLGGYVEFIGVASGAPDPDYAASLGLGLTYSLSSNLQLDAGINIGLNQAADEFNPFIGMSMRF